MKLTKKRTEAINNITSEYFNDIKKAFIDHIRHNSSVERAELKLSTAMQQHKICPEVFTKRIRELLQLFNKIVLIHVMELYIEKTREVLEEHLPMVRQKYSSLGSVIFRKGQYTFPL